MKCGKNPKCLVYNVQNMTHQWKLSMVQQKSVMNQHRAPIKVAPKDDMPMKSKHDSTKSVMNHKGLQ